MSGIDFEAYLVKVLRSLGFEDIAGTPVTGDQGADLLARKDGRKIAIQAKRYKGSVGNAAVQEIVAALKFYR
jgi:HJR/Mrr/RecB family endonuclease